MTRPQRTFTHFWQPLYYKTINIETRCFFSKKSKNLAKYQICIYNRRRISTTKTFIQTHTINFFHTKQQKEKKIIILTCATVRRSAKLRACDNCIIWFARNSGKQLFVVVFLVSVLCILVHHKLNTISNKLTTNTKIWYRYLHCTGHQCDMNVNCRYHQGKALKLNEVNLGFSAEIYITPDRLHNLLMGSIISSVNYVNEAFYV